MDKKDKVMQNFTNAAQDKFEFEEVQMKFKKRTIEEILELSENVDTQKSADEILNWLTKNVAHFIDNKEKEFRIELVIEENSSEDMENIKLLQDLYRAIPDDSDYVDNDKIAEIMSSGNLNDAFEDEQFNKLVECREALDNLSFDIHDKMRESNKLKDLYKAMIYYYEMIGINHGHPLLKDLAGEVDVIEFEYESFNVAVQVLEGKMSIDDDINDKCEKEVIRQYTIPEGFSLLLEIAFVDQSRSLSIF